MDLAKYLLEIGVSHSEKDDDGKLPRELFHKDLQQAFQTLIAR